MAISSDQLKDLHLTVDAHVVVQLGEELISDVEQALLELVKNAYDADSKLCSILIDTAYTEQKTLVASNAPAAPVASNEQTAKIAENDQYVGLIRVVDDGHGMTFDAIQNGWLVVSASSKRATRDGFKERTKKLHRIPIGDKGLGRLSTMKLGDKIRIQTFTESEVDGIELSFKWSDFVSGVPIEKVQIEKTVLKKNGRAPGTTIEIIGLSDINAWLQTNRQHSLRKNLSALVHPFQLADKFSVTLSFNGLPHQIERWTEDQLNLSAAEFSAEWEPNHISPDLPGPNPPSYLDLSAKVRLNLFSASNSKKTQEKAKQLILADMGAKFAEYIKKHRETKGYKFRQDPKDGSFYYGERISIRDIPSLKEYPFWENPGGFESKIHFFMLTQEFEQSDADKAAEVGEISKDRIKEQAGVSIFRDGFRIRLGADWLGLSKEATSGGSFYSMRASNVLGYVNINGHKNSGLMETSNREGFIDNAEYRGFMTIMRRFTKFSNGVLESLRRAANDFYNAEDESQTKPITPEEGVIRLAKTADRVAATQKNFSSLSTTASARLVELQKKAQDVSNDLLTDEKTSAFVSNLIGELQDLQSFLLSENKKIQEATVHIEGEAEAARQISKQFELLHEQIARLYESASIGLAASGMAHDISSHIDEIGGSVKKVRDVVRPNADLYKSVNLYCSGIEASTRSIASYLSVIDPMLPASRTKREVLNLSEFVQNYFDHRSDQISREDIRVSLLNVEQAPTIRIHRGRLLQTLDNMVRNSRYWLDVATRGTNIPKEIHIEFFPWGISLWDSGRGIRETIEDTLFDLFVSDKPENERSGLGLYISRALMEAEGNKLYLAPDRNSLNRRYKFNLDLSSSLQKS